MVRKKVKSHLKKAEKTPETTLSIKDRLLKKRKSREARQRLITLTLFSLIAALAIALPVGLIINIKVAFQRKNIVEALASTSPRCKNLVAALDDDKGRVRGKLNIFGVYLFPVFDRRTPSPFCTVDLYIDWIYLARKLEKLLRWQSPYWNLLVNIY